MHSKKLKLFSKSILAFVLCLTILFTSIPPMLANAASGEWTGGQVEKGYRLKVTYSESSQNAKTNTSVVTATLYLVQDKTYSLYIGTRTATITINGSKKTISDIPAIRNDGNVTTKLGSASATVTHASDGSKSISIAATFDMKATLSGTYYGTMSTSKTVSLTKLDRTAPTVSLKFNSATSNSLKFTATANTTCDTWQYSTNNGSSWVSFGSTGTSNAFTISNLTGGKAYSVVVRARKTSNNVTSAKSAAVSATTKPSPPGGLAVSGITQNSALLSWKSVTGAKSYKAYLNGALKSSGITATNYTFSGLTANTSYKFGVCATGTSGDSSVTSTGNYITLPNVPADLEVTDQTDSGVSLSWSQDNGGNAAETTFNIYRDGVLVGTSTTDSYTDTSYENTDSSYTVSAATSAGESAKSDSVSVTHIEITVNLSAVNNSTYAVITPSFEGGTNREIDYNSLKWDYGEQTVDYFEENGYTFTNSFAVLQNGTYTVYASDTSGNSAVGTIVIEGIYTVSTRGAFVETFTDLSVDSVGIPVSFERTYNSMDNTDNIFGKGWSLNYAKSTRLFEDGSVRLVYLPDGTINYFEVSDNTYKGIQTQNTLVADGNKLILTAKDNTKYTYENDYLTRIEDSNGNTLAIRLNSSHLPSRIIDSVGRVYTISYYNDKITGITDPAGRIFSYVYDNEGNLTEHRRSDETVVNKYIYEDGLLTKITDAFNNTVCEMSYNKQRQVVNMTDADGSSTYYLHKITSNGEIVIYESESEIELDTEDVLNNPPSNTYNPYDQTVIDSDGNCYSYNSDGTIDGINIENTVNISGDYEKVLYSYDSNGNVTHILTTDKADKVLEDDSFTYTYFENSGNISSSVEVLITYTYDEDGELTETDTETITSTYDAAGNLLSERTVHKDEDKTATYTYNAKGMLLTQSADDVVTEYTYNSYGFVTNIKTTEKGETTEQVYGYNIIGQVLSQTENGLTTTNIYDLYGNVIRQTLTDGKVTRVSRVVYDNNNRVIQKIDNSQYDEYDDDLYADMNGISSDNVYLNENVGERYTYDDKGNVLTYINVADNKTVNTYDSENRLVKSVTYENASTASNSLTTRYVYDSEGNLVQTVYPHQYNAENDNLDLSNNVNEYTDTTIGERVTYDEKGNVLTYIDSFGIKTVNTYDGNDNLVKSVSGDEVTRYVYNGGDNLLQVIYPDEYNPDDDNLNLTAETPVDTYANQNVGDRYTYDDDGNILTYTNRFGEVTTNAYNSDGNLTSTTRFDGTVFTYDKDGRVSKETYSNGLTRDFTYSTNQTVIKASNGVNITYNLNAFGEVAEYKLQNGENNKNYSYIYDANGNITSISLNGSLQQTFTYNSSNELIRVDDATVNKSITYAYDYVGNITSVKTYTYTTGTLGTALTTQNYTYNSQNQRTDLSYDAYGNMTALNGYTFGWTNRRLTSAESADNNISYTYNHSGIRTSKTINGTTITYKIDENNNVIEQTDGTNTLKFVYDGANSPIYFTYNDTTYYYEKNMQGDIVAILDTDGNVVVEYTYDSWGKQVSITGALADTIGQINPLRYRGYYYDTETELYYLQSRYYSPDLMRFISQDDPALSNAQGEPLGSNLYIYCLNNPVMNVDPSGYWVFTFGVSIGGAIILGLNLFATLLIDSTGDFGLFIGVTLLYGVVQKGLSYSFGFYWKFKNIDSYLNSVTNSLNVGYGFGGSLVYHYYKYPSSKKRRVGIQLSYGTKGVSWETAAFDGGAYIPLKEYLTAIFKKAGKNVLAIKKIVKNLRFKFYFR